ncbi:multidrug ABC transporter permease [Nitrosomonas aestuarii]|uniref:multidrug ABC transporter permease n=1 Tax=Nitrosomonas aestuarii TaxID=52441 RepID=UPI000D4760AC|nr:multidrug ABC transporter permease [Nitrosomonas aestuarii]PTN11869.1 hypothetical protein C8R11_1064 [Nitrosomonas aestuarii]
MQFTFRVIVSLLMFGIVLFFIQTILLITTELTGLISVALSLVCAACVGWYSWQSFSSKKMSVSASVLNGALILGGLGFIFGFFGPMLLVQDTQQAIFFGIIVACPIGLILGAIGGYVFASRKRD